MKNPKAGFTIIELMAAMVATAIFAMAVGAVLFYVWTGWRRNTVSVQMQRDTTLAMQVIAREIRRTPLEDIAPGTSLTCVNGTGKVAIMQNNGNLNMQVNADPAFTLVRDHVVSFTTSTNANGAVRVALSLYTGSDASKCSMVVYSRN